MLKRLGFIAALCGVMLLGRDVITSASASSLEAESSAFITELADKAVSSLTAKDANRGERISRFRSLFNESFAVRSIGKFVLGRYWKKASDDERKEYLGLFEDLMVVSYVDRFAQYAGESLMVKKTRGENKSTATVFSEIERPGGAKAIRINWRVGTNGKIYKILDVVVEGTSMSNTLRSDFSSIIRRNGGKVAGLIDELRIKTAALKTE